MDLVRRPAMNGTHPFSRRSDCRLDCRRSALNTRAHGLRSIPSRTSERPDLDPLETTQRKKHQKAAVARSCDQKIRHQNGGTLGIQFDRHLGQFDIVQKVRCDQSLDGCVMYLNRPIFFYISCFTTRGRC
jgi:hypothetical protein